MTDPCQSEKEAAAKALGDYRSARAKAERLERSVKAARESGILLTLLTLIGDDLNRQDIEDRADAAEDAMDDVQALLEEDKAEADQNSQNALATLDAALDKYCVCLDANEFFDEPIDPGEEEDEEEEDDTWEEIDALLEDLAEAFDEVEDEWYDDDE